MSSQKILVTGGAGYIGSHICKSLAARGDVPITVDNLSTGHPWAVKWGELEQCDIRDDDRLSNVFERHKPDAVMHFAAHCYVGESVNFPEKYYNNNVGGMMTLLNVMRQHSVNYLVFSSSSATYGEPLAIPMDESHPQNPTNPYGFTKYVGERMMLDFEVAYGLGFVSLRYFNAAGADPEFEIGEVNDPESHLIPLILEAASGRRKEISIFGTDYKTHDGTCIRDYIHVSDLADAHLRALDYLLAGKKSQFLNLGNGNGYSVREVIELGIQITGQAINIIEGPRRAGDPSKLISDSTQAKRILGWEPRRSNLQTIIEDAWQWHQKYYI